MKNLFAIASAALMLFVLTSCETNSGVSEAFSKYSHQKGVTTLTVPGWVIGLAASFGDLESTERDLLESIDKVKVLTVDDYELNARIDLHEEFHSKINKNQEYEELLTVRDKGENITIFGKMTENVISEMVILVGGNDNVLVYLRGEIKPEMINNVAGLSKSQNLLGLK